MVLFSYATVLHNFEARFGDELSVQAGYSVRIVQLVDSEWAQCWNPVDCEQGRCLCIVLDFLGLVPQSFLQIFLDDDDGEATETTPAATPVSQPADVPWNHPFAPEADNSRLSAHSLEPEDSHSAKDSGNASLSSVNAEGEKLSNVDKEFDELFGLKRQSKPSRPPPPLVSAMRAAPSPPASNSSNEPWQTSFNKIVEELLASETNYNLELNAWEEVSAALRRTSPNFSASKCLLG